MMMMVILNYKADLIPRQRDCSARCVEEQASAEEERRSLLSSCLSVASLSQTSLRVYPSVLTFTCISREQRVRQELWRDLLVQEISSRFGGQKGITITIITIRKRGILADPLALPKVL